MKKVPSFTGTSSVTMWFFNHNVSSPEGNTRFKFLGIPSLDQKKNGRSNHLPAKFSPRAAAKEAVAKRYLHRVRSAPVNFNGESSPQTRRENKRSLQSSWLDTYNEKDFQYYPNLKNAGYHANASNLSIPENYKKYFFCRLNAVRLKTQTIR